MSDITIAQPSTLSPQSSASGARPPALCPQPLYACLHAPLAGHGHGTLVELARDFSPRFECHRDDLISIDIRGLDRLLGDPHAIGAELRRSADARGLRLQVAIAATRTAAMVLAQARPGLTVVARHGEAAAVAPIPVAILEKITDQPSRTQRSPRGHDRHSKDPAVSVIPAVKRWGIRTLGEFAALPAADVAARLGRHGLVWQTMARGQDIRPLVPTLAEERFESSTELEWPIEELEPLSFVLTRLLEPLLTRLERRDRGAAAVHVTLDLVKGYDEAGRAGGSGGSGRAGGKHASHDDQRGDRRERGENFVESSASSAASALNVVAGDVYTRTLELPAPLRDVRTLRTLILLDLESHPPPAPVEGVTVIIDPTPGRVLQHTLFTRAHPTPEQLSTLIARLTALMGQDRIGRPALVDSYRPGAFGMRPFATNHDDQRGDRGARRDTFVQNSASSAASASNVVSALRRCRHPVPARVAVAAGRPAAVTTDRRGFAGGRVQVCTGPWRTSGDWWEHPGSWNRDEWDVSLADGAAYRIFRDRVTDGWFIDAIVD